MPEEISEETRNLVLRELSDCLENHSRLQSGFYDQDVSPETSPANSAFRSEKHRVSYSILECKIQWAKKLDQNLCEYGYELTARRDCEFSVFTGDEKSDREMNEELFSGCIVLTAEGFLAADSQYNALLTGFRVCDVRMWHRAYMDKATKESHRARLHLFENPGQNQMKTFSVDQIDDLLSGH